MSSRTNPQYLQCDRTLMCGNDACFWRQRDAFGRNPFPHCQTEEGRRLHDERMTLLPPPLFPEMTVEVGTNCLYLICKERRSSPNPRIVLLTEGWVVGDGAGYTTPGWYFWDETDAYCYGPFPIREAATSALDVHIGLMASINFPPED